MEYETNNPTNRTITNNHPLSEDQPQISSRALHILNTICTQDIDGACYDYLCALPSQLPIAIGFLTDISRSTKFTHALKDTLDQVLQFHLLIKLWSENGVSELSLILGIGKLFKQLSSVDDAIVNPCLMSLLTKLNSLAQAVTYQQSENLIRLLIQYITQPDNELRNRIIEAFAMINPRTQCNDVAAYEPLIELMIKTAELDDSDGSVNTYSQELINARNYIGCHMSDRSNIMADYAIDKPVTAILTNMFYLMRELGIKVDSDVLIANPEASYQTVFFILQLRLRALRKINSQSFNFAFYRYLTDILKSLKATQHFVAQLTGPETLTAVLNKLNHEQNNLIQALKPFFSELSQLFNKVDGTDDRLKELFSTWLNDPKKVDIYQAYQKLQVITLALCGLNTLLKQITISHETGISFEFHLDYEKTFNKAIQQIASIIRDHQPLNKTDSDNDNESVNEIISVALTKLWQDVLGNSLSEKSNGLPQLAIIIDYIQGFLQLEHSILKRLQQRPINDTVKTSSQLAMLQRYTLPTFYSLLGFLGVGLGLRNTINRPLATLFSSGIAFAGYQGHSYYEAVRNFKLGLAYEGKHSIAAQYFAKAYELYPSNPMYLRYYARAQLLALKANDELELKAKQMHLLDAIFQPLFRKYPARPAFKFEYMILMLKYAHPDAALLVVDEIFNSNEQEIQRYQNEYDHILANLYCLELLRELSQEVDFDNVPNSIDKFNFIESVVEPSTNARLLCIYAELLSKLNRNEEAIDYLLLAYKHSLNDPLQLINILGQLISLNCSQVAVECAQHILNFGEGWREHIDYDIKELQKTASHTPGSSNNQSWLDTINWLQNTGQEICSRMLGY